MTGPLVAVVSSPRRTARRRLLRFALSLCIVLGFSRMGLAQAPARPFIRNVTLSAIGDVLTITGSGFGTNPEVTFDGAPVPVLPGASDTQITIVTPSVLLTTVGTYRLTVVDPVIQAGEVFVVVSSPGAVTPAPAAAGAAGGTETKTPKTAATTAETTASRSTTPQPLSTEQSTFPHKTALGYQALINNITTPTSDPTAGDFNTAVGFQAMQFNTTGGYNTAAGTAALYKNTSGSYNTALGLRALAENTTGFDNTATGEWALEFNTTGSGNTANGLDSLNHNTSGSYNTGIGRQANWMNTTGEYNTSLGMQSLYSNTTGAYNTATGAVALYNNLDGMFNTAAGLKALYGNVSGSYNAADGYQALYFNTSGNNNTATGYAALLSNATGSFNTAVGKSAGLLPTSGSYNIYLGAEVTGTANDTNTIRIGSPYTGSTGQYQTFIAGIHGVSLAGTLPVVIDADGRLGTSGGSSPLTVFDASNTHSDQLRVGYVNGTADYGIGRNPTDGFLNFTGTQPTYSGFRFSTPNAPAAVTIANNGVVSVLDSTNSQPFQLRLGFRSNIDYGIGRNPSDGFLNFTGTQPTFSGFRFNTANAPSAVTITNSGNVGLGVSGPTRPLEAANGAFLSAGGVWTNASSRSLKDRVEPLSAAVALETVSGLEPVTFVYKASSADPHVGFIAEDVPALVATPDRRGLAAMDIVAVVTKAVQVQQQQLLVQEQQIRDQDAIIAELRARVSRLEALLGHSPTAVGPR